MKILMVLTSHDQLGNTGRKTGFWLEEFAGPYFVFRDAGVQLTLASPKGGQPPIDPKSDLLKRVGGLYEKTADWQPFSIIDGRLITGQNPASSTSAAQALLNVLHAEKAA